MSTSRSSVRRAEKSDLKQVFLKVRLSIEPKLNNIIVCQFVYLLHKRGVHHASINVESILLVINFALIRKIICTLRPQKGNVLISDIEG